MKKYVIQIYKQTKKKNLIYQPICLFYHLYNSAFVIRLATAEKKISLINLDKNRLKGQI